MWKVYNVIGMVRRTTFICSSTCPAEHVEQRGWRNGSTQPNYKIYTSNSLLKYYQTGSPNVNQYKYLLTNNTAGFTDPCSDTLFASVPETDPYEDEKIRIDMDNAEAIALQEQEYINYVEVGNWMETKTLYDRLVVSEDFRHLSSILSSFYDNYQQSEIGNINRSDLALAALFDFKGDGEDMAVRYNEAMSQINTISGEEYEVNEKEMDDIALRLAMYGTDSVSLLQQTELEVLANTCPFVGGSAVYKARTLWATFNPIAQYNDRLLCLQSAVQDKNSSNGYMNIDSLEELKTNVQATAILQQIKAQEIIATNKIVNKDLICIYPNPANNYVEIKYSSDADGVFKLYNSIGEQIGNYSLSKEVNTQRLQLNSIANGVYHYDIEFANKKKSIGKLTIIK